MKANKARLNFRLDFRLNSDQVYADHWRNCDDRICQYKGKCPVCKVRMYWFSDGENDPRGVLGDHTATWTSAKDEALGDSTEEFWYCFLCSSDEQRYRAMRELLLERERKGEKK